MKNKKAWLRIVEAFIALIVIIGVIIYVISERDINSNSAKNIYNRENQILDIISRNNTLRSEIVNDNSTGVDRTVAKMIPSNWNFTTNVCDIESICNNVSIPNDREVYVNEVLITSTLNDYNPKKLRIFIWLN